MENLNDLCQRTLAAAKEVHRHLGPGLFEAIYEHCLALELKARAVPFAEELVVPLRYRGEILPASYRVPFVVGEELLVDIKAVERLLPVHRAHLRTCLRMSGKRHGLIINFEVAALEDGVERLYDDY